MRHSPYELSKGHSLKWTQDPMMRILRLRSTYYVIVSKFYGMFVWREVGARGEEESGEKTIFHCLVRQK